MTIAHVADVLIGLFALLRFPDPSTEDKLALPLADFCASSLYPAPRTLGCVANFLRIREFNSHLEFAKTSFSCGSHMSEQSSLCSVFLLQEKYPPASLLLIFCRKLRLTHLFACKRACDGSLSLPAF